MIKFFEKLPEVLAVMSERENGSMKLTTDDLNVNNRQKFFNKIGIEAEKVISADLQNGTEVAIVSADSPRIIYGSDALVTSEKNIFLAITVADCIPVYICEPQNKIVALVHCGWRGIVGGIIENTLGKILALGGRAENLKIALGPGIGKCHFEIKEDVLEKFSQYPEFIEKREGKMFVDLKSIITAKLLERSVKLENMEDIPECTFESRRYFSYRRDKPETIEAMLAVMGIK